MSTTTTITPSKVYMLMKISYIQLQYQQLDQYDPKIIAIKYLNKNIWKFITIAVTCPKEI
jgi:hypothetical protein